MCDELGISNCLEMTKGVKKNYLLAILQEIGEEANLNLRVVELKDLKLKSKEYSSDKDFVIEFLANAVTDRKNG